MTRTIAGVVLGYIATALLVFLLFSASYLALGTDKVFLPGSYQVSFLWAALSIVVSFAAALVGGYVAASVSRGTRAPLVLACVVLVLGILFALPALGQPDPGPRAGDVGNFAAMTNARPPSWTLLLNPIIGALGVLVGSRLRRTEARP
jgi:hypothetical protein